MRPLLRAPDAHVSEVVCNLLKSLSLGERLKRNKAIEMQNNLRIEKTLNNAYDASRHGA